MPAPLHQDATAYLKQQGIPITTNSLNRTMNLLQQEPNLRPSYSGQGAMDVDIETMRPVNQKIEGRSLPPLQNNSNTNNSFGQAFKAARKQLGAGKTFDWNGKKYTTDYKEEVEKKNPVKLTSGVGEADKPGDDNSPHDPINSEAVDDIQQGLAEEDQQFTEMDEKKRNTKRVSAGRGGYVDMPMDESEIANRDMDDMLNALIGGGAAVGVGGAAAAAAMGNRDKPKGPQSMREGDLYNKSADPRAGQMQDEDLFGEKPRQMTKGDIGFQDRQLNEMVDADLYGKPATDADYLNEVLKGADWVDEEKYAAKLMLAGNKKEAQKLLPKLKNLGADKKLLSIIKGMM